MQRVLQTFSGMNLARAVRVLNEYCMPHLADSWDNVGLLIEPTGPHLVQCVLITNDLTESVLEEAIEHKANLILSYHPPIFTPLKRITQSHWKERLVASCLENRIAVYSPHTGLDAKNGGINDWLLSPFVVGVKKPLIAKSVKSTYQALLQKNENFCRFLIKTGSQFIAQPSSVSDTVEIEGFSIDLPDVEVQAKHLGLTFHARELFSDAAGDFEGYGRVACLNIPKRTQEIIDDFKKLFAVNHVVLALGKGRTLDTMVYSIAVCAGSGGSVLCKNQLALSADLMLTGEMSHHDRLDMVSRGISVILTGHSVSERGFLVHQLAPDLSRLLNKEAGVEYPPVSVRISTKDHEPGCFV